MAWIESHQSLGRHPKLIRFARLLKLSRPAAIGHLHYLWWWAMDYAPDGVLAHFDDAQVAQACEWTRDPGKIVAALIKSGFLDPDRFIHDWPEYAGKLIERQRANTARKREARKAATTDGDVPAVSRGHPEDVPGTDGGILPPSEATVPDLTLPTVPTEPNQEPTYLGPPSANGRRTREPDEVFEAVVEACGWAIEHLTKDARGRANAAAAQLRELEARPALIRGFGVQWRMHYPDTNVTPQTITSHWADYMASNLSTPARRRR